jgi:integrase
LSHVPPNRTKLYKGLTLTEAIARAKAAGRSGLGSNTQQVYLAALCDLLELAFNKDLIRKNYAEKLRPLAAEDLAPEAKRAPFDAEQIKAFFHSPYYRSCADAGDVPYRHADKAWRYWFPLLSISTGMRPKEIFQLHVDDVRRTKIATWYLEVVATDDDKQSPEF